MLRRNDSPDSQLFKMSDGFEDENGTVYTRIMGMVVLFYRSSGNVTALEAVKQVRITVNSTWGNNV